MPGGDASDQLSAEIKHETLPWVNGTITCIVAPAEILPYFLFYKQSSMIRCS
jgi:hypothetical protein